MTHILKLSAFFALLLLIPSIMLQGKNASPNFDKAAFYSALSANNIDEINLALAQLKHISIPEKTAYEGALLMKKAGLVTKPKEKLSLFKSGRTKLEEAIKTDAGNVEYYFLRLIIQENAPKIVKYKTNLISDTELVRASFKKLPPVVQKAVRDYSKKSKFLKPGDF